MFYIFLSSQTNVQYPIPTMNLTVSTLYPYIPSPSLFLFLSLSLFSSSSLLLHLTISHSFYNLNALPPLYFSPISLFLSLSFSLSLSSFLLSPPPLPLSFSTFHSFYNVSLSMTFVHRINLQIQNCPTVFNTYPMICMLTLGCTVSSVLTSFCASLSL